uniref:Uncharacterized protein n=1 Tax=Rhizophora mucronata TaxID=61149 RepID=A0A2P2NLR6_RHIMU
MLDHIAPSKQVQFERALHDFLQIGEHPIFGGLKQKAKKEEVKEGYFNKKQNQFKV